MSAEHPIFPEVDESETRCSVRYSLHLPVRIVAKDREFQARTENISSNGVLFRLDEYIPADTPIEFLLEFPPAVLGNNCTAAAHCVGRVVRSYQGPPHYFAAAIIDEYRFQ
jgi:hypothetical protein